WAGVTNILDVTAGDNSWSYFPGVTGMWYWNESFGEDSVQYLDLMIDWDDDGDRFAGIGVDIPNYGIGLTSQPTPTLDPATGNIYVMFAQPVENTDYAEDPTADGAQSFRDLFGIYTTDGGQSWSGEINLTYVAHNNYENLYISTTSTTEGDKVHALWWQDQEPGNAFETPIPDAIGPHSIVYNGWDFSRFEPYDPSADFSFFIPDPGVTGEVEFTNASADADSYAWNFGDGGSSSSINPSHDYAEGGDYNVCLTAENHYGSNVSCKTVTVTDFVGIEDIALNKALQIFPSPSNGNVNVAINNDNFHSATVEVFNMLGESVMNAITMNVNANNTMALDLTSVAEGNYVVKVLGDNGGIAVRQLTIAH
ncbi:MAG: PKD domain-containing protein, partial [Chitinophagales bacterium]|nr:PKD domain-containing protein [Chitinophagales bacterium]